MMPQPVSVWYNDWQQIDVSPFDAFRPTLPVSVIVPYYEIPELLALTMAALEGQTYPRDLFEVVIVDDGSRVPLEWPWSTPLTVKVVHQEDRGFGLARARNTGVRAATHDILVFLDGDMLPEADWLMAHARWHHAVSDILTLGFRVHVAVNDVNAAMIRERTGSLENLFVGREVDLPWTEPYMSRTRQLTSRDDDLFRVMVGANFGIGREFYALVGGFDESFTRWGSEDTEFAYRAYTRGGVLVPVREAFAWHQGRWAEDRERKVQAYHLQMAKTAHLIAHEDFRNARLGRTFTVPQYVVTIEAADLAADRIIETTELVLADRVHDLVIRIEMWEDDERLVWLGHQFGPDPRVRVGPMKSTLDEFPSSAFHVTLPAGVAFARDVVHRLRRELGSSVAAMAVLSDGSQVTITRAWALHRARRTSQRVTDFGDVITIPARRLLIMKARLPDVCADALRQRLRALRLMIQKVLVRMGRVRTSRQAWWFLEWVASVVRGKAAQFARTRRYGTPLPPIPKNTQAKAAYPLCVGIVALGPRSQAVFRSSSRVAHRLGRDHVDVVVADTPTEVNGIEVPTVVLSEAPPQFSVPAFDPWTYNPMGWVRNVTPVVAALGPLDRLPLGVEAHRVIRTDDRAGLRWIHHLEDAQAFHGSVIERAGELARLAATGVVVHLADDDSQLRAYLGAELHDLMTTDVRIGDLAARESLSIRMRRAALRAHSLRSRARQICEAVLADPPPLPLVSILLVTKRPDCLPGVLASVARQTYPRLELVLGMHGEGFAGVECDGTGLGLPSTVVRISGGQSLGSALNVLVAASRGTLLAKMDDDDLYDPEHIWDLVLAHEYSQAQLVGKGSEFVYLARLDQTIHRFCGGGETYSTALGGGALLMARHDLDRVGGWRRVHLNVDLLLKEDIARAGGRVYRTHGAGFMIVRHGRQHTWKKADASFLVQAETIKTGWDPTLASITDVPSPLYAHPRD